MVDLTKPNDNDDDNPGGVIDGSILTAVGLLLMFSVIEKIPEAIKAGRSIKVTKGDFSAEIDSE